MTGPSSRGSVPGDLRPRDLVHAAYRLLWQGRGELLRVAAVPVAVTLAIDAALFFGREVNAPGAPGAWFYLLLLLSIPPSVLFAVNWLRVLVLGSAAVPGLGLRWGRREAQFLQRILVIGLAGLAASFVLILPIVLVVKLIDGGFGPLRYLATWLPYTSIFLVLFVYAYFTLGLSLALVAAAIDAPGTLADSWRATQGRRGSLVLAVIPVAGPFYFLLYLLPLVIALLGIDRVAPLSSLLLQTLAATLTSAAGLAFLSVVYGRIAGVPIGPR